MDASLGNYVSSTLAHIINGKIGLLVSHRNTSYVTYYACHLGNLYTWLWGRMIYNN